jgi:hypothetical protein
MGSTDFVLGAVIQQATEPRHRGGRGLPHLALTCCCRTNLVELLRGCAAAIRVGE